MPEEESKEQLLRGRWIGQEKRIQKIIKSVRKNEDWTVHLEGLPFVEEIQSHEGNRLGKDLRGADLVGVDFYDQEFMFTDFGWADLRDADLCGAGLLFANMKGVDLRCAKLIEADLAGANLSDVDFKGADLGYANLRGADLSNSKNIQEANLEGANLCDANMEGTGFEWDAILRKKLPKGSIFLCHSSKDKDFVRKLARELREYGARVWLDEVELKIGESLTKRIGDAIDECDFFGIVLSNNSINSDWVQRELREALQKEIIRKKDNMILPLMLEPVEMPSFLGDRVYADFTYPEKYRDNILKLLRTLDMEKT